jgi:hypothetical protein
MTDLTDTTADTTGMTVTGRDGRPEFGLVAVDLYRDIHKGIRSELFAAVVEAGRLDPVDHQGRAALAAQVRDVVALLVSHAEHEDTAVQPSIEAHLPRLAEVIAGDHEALEDRMATLVDMADGAVDAPGAELRARTHQLYLELADFTGAYLRHQEVEERVVMPALESAIGVEATLGIHQAIVGSIPPEEMARSLALMLPVMNVDDRTELLGGMQQGAPAEVFAGVWSLVGSVLEPTDVAALDRRLGLA